MLLDFGKANPIEKARQQPDKVRMVLQKMRTDGLVATIEAVRNKLDQAIPLGYCNVGRVIGVGGSVNSFAIGARVASNGRHAEVVSVPVNLSARIPDSVSDEAAAFTVVGAIALQGLRLAQPTLGETVAVIGLGLIGQMAVQLLRAQGCHVLAADFDSGRLDLARAAGADTVDLAHGGDPIVSAKRLTHGRGVDAVIVTAATKSNEPMYQAAQMCRQRGRIVLVGVTGLELSRADFYEKELTFQVSCSYGPGRYDPQYEEKGHDYPIGFVRWTEQRNFEAVLDMMASGRLDVAPLISHRFAFDVAESAYEVLGGDAPSLGILIEYSKTDDISDGQLRRSTVAVAKQATAPDAGVVGRDANVAFIGAGNYATAVLMPAFKQAGARLKTVVSRGGVSGVHAGRKFGFSETTTDLASVFADPTITAIAIATRHDSHAQLTCQALSAHKHVFVEKPLALSNTELEKIAAVYDGASKQTILMVGFNRRFAPHVKKIKALLDGAPGPKVFVMTVNAGAIAANHWTQDPEAGGGRVLGEACHFIDLLRFLAQQPIVAQRATPMAGGSGDTTTIQLGFADGSIGTIHYLTNGSKTFPKERLEVFASGRVLQLDNFRRLTGHGWPGFRRMNLWRQDKGQIACAQAFIDAVRRVGPSPIPVGELFEVGRVTVELANSLSS